MLAEYSAFGVIAPHEEQTMILRPCINGVVQAPIQHKRPLALMIDFF
jgi:hypothetical protein